MPGRRGMKLVAGIAAVAAILLTGLVGAVAFMVTGDADGRSHLTRMIEAAASGPDQRLSISGVQGVLSSDVRIERIEVADSRGVWLTIRDARLVWSRAALLTGTFDADLLQAGEIVVARAPEGTAPAAEPAEPFDLSHLPLAIRIDSIDAPHVRIGAELIGKAATLALKGAAELAPGITEAALTVDVQELGSAPVDNLRLFAKASGIDGGQGGFSINASLSGLEALDERVSGGLAMAAQIGPGLTRPEIDAVIDGRDLVLMQKPFSNARAQLSGDLEGAQLALRGNLAGAAVELSAVLAGLDGEERFLRKLDASIGATRASGALRLRKDGLAEGAISVSSDDLSDIGALLLVEAAGALDAKMELSSEDGVQSAKVVAQAQGLVFDKTTIASVDVALTARNLLAQPQISGRIAASEISSGEVVVRRLEANATPDGRATLFEAAADLDQGKLEAAGALQPNGGRFDLTLGRLELTGPTTLTLAQPVTLTVQDGVVALPAAVLAIGDGRISVAGRAGETLDLAATIEALPLSIANAFAPALGAQGKLSGKVNVSGPAADPLVTFAVQGDGLSAAPAREAGAPPLKLALKGEFAQQIATLDGRVTGPSGLSVQVAGKIPADAAGLDIKLNAALPLVLTEAALAARGARASGMAHTEMRISGAIDAPIYEGVVTTNGASFTDGASGLALSNIVLRARLGDNRAAIEQLTAKSGGGSIAVSGGIALNAGFPADLKIALRNATYEDGKLVAATASGDLTVIGKLAEAKLGGRIDIARAEITVPEKMAGGGVAVDVEHKGADNAVKLTLKSAGLNRDVEKQSRDGKSGVFAMDLTVSAPARIFLRGRGLDAELGGEVRLFGAAGSLGAQGAFKMRRGRLSILGQRIDFDRGAVTLDGDLDPLLDFAATTRGEGILVTATVTGRASDPQIALSSVPELPQDEVLAQFLFKRSVSQLSPVQMAQLGAAAAEMSGLMGGGPGVLGNLRASTALDDLDIETDAAGNRGVKAGRYINENIYLGVRGGEANTSGVTLDMNITDNLKARGETDATGKSSVGVFFEREY